MNAISNPERAEEVVSDAGKDVALIPAALVPEQVFRQGGITEILSRLETDVRAQAEHLDISTLKGRKAIASLAHKVARSKTALDDMGKELTDAIRAQTESIHADRRTVRERLDALRDEVRKPLDDFEEADRQRVIDHQAALRQIEQCASLPVDQHAWTMEVVASREAELAGIFARDWKEFSTPAARARDIAATALADVRAQLIREAEECAERERLAAEEAERRRVQAEQERQEREARIAAEAAEKARREAEARAEAARIEAEQKVERERIEAERKAAAEREAAQQAAAAAERERQRIEAEQRAAERRAEEARQQAEAAERRRIVDAEAAEKARQRAAEEHTLRLEAEKKAAVEADRKRQAAEVEALRVADERRAANIAHRRKVNQSIVAALALCGLTDEQSQAVIAAVVRGQVPNMRIDY